MQIFAIVVSLAITVVAVAFTVRAVRSMLATIKIGQPVTGRTDNPGRRTVTMLKETFLHTRMLQWTWVGILHWFAFAAFIVLATAVMGAYGQLFDAHFALPIIGHWPLYTWVAEFLGLLGTLAIIPLIIYRVRNRPSAEGRKSRFFGSTMWQAYFVEAMVLLESSAILFIRGAEYKLMDGDGAEFPISQFFSVLYPTDNEHTLENIIYFIAMVKIVSAMVWLLMIANNLTMGVAWHRFTAWFNIWFKRESTERRSEGAVPLDTALGALKPLTSAGKPITLDDIDDLDEESVLGVGSIQDFSWKGILDFTTCTECGRCQSQCPAWNTEKPLSPKLLMMGLREHAYATAEGSESAAARTSLIGSGAGSQEQGASTDVQDWFYNPEGADYVIDEDVLWSCTSCGACVQQCPVDIEHVDHIVDMRRYQVLVESNFPAELNGLFKGLENKGNPWNMSANARMDWAKDLPFDVKVVGEDIESLESVDWLFWVGCAGAYEDRAKKTTRAVAELLDIAGVSFGVLGNGETCTGDPARRAGNEFVFQGLAQQNVETFKEYKVKKVVSTCAHCFNTLKNEYKHFGIELEVVHHTQLLNRLVREGKLTPVKDGEGAHKRSITYHDPCYIGRHNGVYAPPRELLQVLPGAEFKEMDRNSERSFCCGAGGARMWMEETLGERINVNRTKEAVATGADQIAVGCPFCRVMLADGLTAEQAKGEAREEVEILDVAQMLLASVKGKVATKLKPGAAQAAPAAKAAGVATKAEPEAGDVTLTENTVADPADVGANAKASDSLFGDAPTAPASSGSSLFDAAPAPTEQKSSGSLFDEAPAPAEQKSSGSLFDTPAPAEQKSSGSLFDTPAPAAPAPAAEKPAGDLGSGSLFDVAAPAEAPKAEAPAAAKPAADLGGGGSLFDIATPAEAPKAEAPAAPAEAPKAEAPKAEAPQTDLNAGGSLFDIAAPAEAPKTEAAAPAAEAPKTEAAAPAAEAPKAEAAAPAAPAAPAQNIDLSGSLFDIAAPAEAPKAETPREEAPAPAPVSEAPKAEAPTPATPAAPATPSAPAAPAAPAAAAPEVPSVDINAMGSLFDIAAPEPAAPATPAPVAEEPAAEPAAAAESVPEESAPEAAVEADAVKDSAPVAETAPAGSETAAESEVDAEADAEPKAEPAKRATPVEANTPKQADINQASSLFDL